MLRLCRWPRANRSFLPIVTRRSCGPKVRSLFGWEGRSILPLTRKDCGDSKTSLRLDGSLCIYVHHHICPGQPWSGWSKPPVMLIWFGVGCLAHGLTLFQRLNHHSPHPQVGAHPAPGLLNQDLRNEATKPSRKLDLGTNSLAETNLIALV